MERDQNSRRMPRKQRKKKGGDGIKECDYSPNGKHFYNLDVIEINGERKLATVCIWCGGQKKTKG